MIELSTKGTFTTLEELLTGKVYIGTVPRHDVHDPFQDAMPCWHPAKVWPWTRKRHPLEEMAESMGNSNAFRK